MTFNCFQFHLLLDVKLLKCTWNFFSQVLANPVRYILDLKGQSVSSKIWAANHILAGAFQTFPWLPLCAVPLSKTSCSFWQPSVVCCEEGSTNTLIMADTNVILKMITNTLAISQNVPEESCGSLASHADVLKGSSRVPAPRTWRRNAWRTLKNVYVEG